MSEIVQPEASRRYQQESARVAMRVLADNINEGLSEAAWLVDGSDPRQTQYSEYVGCRSLDRLLLDRFGVS